MASIRARRSVAGNLKFHAQVRLVGFPARTASFSSKREATRWARVVEAEMIEGRHYRSVEARRRTVAQAVARYLAEEVQKKRDGRMHRYCLPWWRDALGPLKLADVTPAVIVEQRGRLSREMFSRAKPTAKRSTMKGKPAPRYRRTGATVNRYLAVFGSMLTTARKEWHWLAHNPMDGVSKLKEGRGRIRYLNNDERARLLAETAKDPKLHVFVMLALTTACRAGELLRLTWRDVDLSEGRLLFRITKTDQPRAAWLHGEAARLLSEYARVRRLDTERVFPNDSGGAYDYAKPFKVASQAAKLEDFRFHDLRHSAATYLAMAGATEQQLRAIGGWRSSIANRYVHIASTDARAILGKLSDKIDGIAPSSGTAPSNGTASSNGKSPNK